QWRQRDQTLQRDQKRRCHALRPVMIGAAVNDAMADADQRVRAKMALDPGKHRFQQGMKGRRRLCPALLLECRAVRTACDEMRRAADALDLTTRCECRIVAAAGPIER